MTTRHASTLLLALLAAPVLRAAEEKPLPKDLPPFGEDRPLVVPKIVQSKTAEGLSVWLVPRPGFPKVVAILAVRGGTAADPKGLEGMSEILASTLNEGTATRTSKQIAEDLQAIGGELEASASDDAVIVSANGLATGTTRLLEVLADVARHASFPAEEVELAKGNALQGLQVRASTPEFLADKAFAAAVYGDHPYKVAAPTPEVITGVTPQVLRQERARRFRPDRALLVIAGDLDPAATSRTIARVFAGWKGEGEPPAPTPASPGAAGRRILVVDRPGSVQSLILAGRPTVTARDDNYFPLLVANTVFGGSFGSRLTKNVREDKGYSYSPFAQNRSFEQGGLLRVRADVRTEVTAPTLLEIFYEMDRMGATAVGDEELRRAKRFQSGLYLLRNQIQRSVAGTLATNWVNGLPPEALGQFVPKVNAVTADQVRQVGRTIFPSSTQTVVVVGDEKKIKDELALFGAVAEVKP